MGIGRVHEVVEGCVACLLFSFVVSPDASIVLDGLHPHLALCFLPLSSLSLSPLPHIAPISLLPLSCLPLPSSFRLTGIKSQYRTRRDLLVSHLLNEGGAHLDARQSSSLPSTGPAPIEMWTKSRRDEKGFSTEKGEGAKKVLSFVAPEGGMFGASLFLSH
jgi:hypothetical protein